MTVEELLLALSESFIQQGRKFGAKASAAEDQVNLEMNGTASLVMYGLASAILDTLKITPPDET